MIYERIRLCVTVMSVALLGIGTVQANVVHYADIGVFQGLGTIAESYDFEGDLAGEGGVYDPWQSSWSMPNGWETHGITYVGSCNKVHEPGHYSMPASNVFTTSFGAVHGIVTAGPQYDLFGVDLAAWLYHPWYPVDITIRTNLSDYDFLDVSVPWVRNGMDFHGWMADPGEWITEFWFHGAAPQFQPAIDNVVLGDSGPAAIPEPCTLLLLGPGFVMFALLRRRQMRKSN